MADNKMTEIKNMSLGRLCETCAALCTLAAQQAGAAGYTGGICPGNICVAEDGTLTLKAPESEKPTDAELSFIAPEVFWNGENSAAADVYSIGLVLYYGATHGALPFENETDPATARGRRLAGKPFGAPKKAGTVLGPVIEKATAYKPEDRYPSLGELKTALESCAADPNLEASVPEEPETVSVEGPAAVTEAAAAAETEAAEAPEADAPAAEAPAEETAEPEQHTEEAEAPAEPAAEAAATESEATSGEQVREYIPEHKTAADTELPHIEPERTASFVQSGSNIVYGKNLDRERDLAEEVRQRRRRPFIVMALLCSVLILIAVAVNTYNKLNSPATPVQTEELYIAIETPVIEITPAPTAEPVAAETQAPVVEHSYQVFTEDVSWTEAKAKCEALGGHLVTISSAEEYQQVISLVENNTGATKVWIGCHRENGSLIWENNANISFYVWGDGEPSEYDWGDNVAEDYVLMWYHNYGWYYNDSRNDPVSDYPDMYSGQIAYVCEFGE